MFFNYYLNDFLKFEAHLSIRTRPYTVFPLKLHLDPVDVKPVDANFVDGSSMNSLASLRPG